MVTNRDDSTSGSGVQERVLSVLLNEMDGIGSSIDNFEVRKIISLFKTEPFQSKMTQNTLLMLKIYEL